MAAWSGEDTWLPSGDYGAWNVPDSLPPKDLTYIVTLADDSTKIIDVLRDGNTWYVWAFNSLEATADANGNHYGIHDLCAYFAYVVP